MVVVTNRDEAEAPRPGSVRESTSVRGTAIYSLGVDWSGDPGHPDKPGSSRFLIMVAVQVSRQHLSELERGLDDLRKRLKFDERHAFRHANCTTRLRAQFLNCICAIEFAAWASIIDKSMHWRESFRPSDPGDQRLVLTLLAVLAHMPHSDFQRTHLLLDIPKAENHRVRQWSQEIRQHYRHGGTSSFRRVMSQADTDEGGSIIQVADMLAGSLNLEMRGELVLPSAIRRRITIV